MAQPTKPVKVIATAITYIIIAVAYFAISALPIIGLFSVFGASISHTTEALAVTCVILAIPTTAKAYKKACDNQWSQ